MYQLMFWQLKQKHLRLLIKFFMLQFVTVLTQHNGKLFQCLKSGFKVFFWNKYQQNINISPKAIVLLFINPSAQEINMIYVLLFQIKNAGKFIKGTFIQCLDG